MKKQRPNLTTTFSPHTPPNAELSSYQLTNGLGDGAITTFSPALLFLKPNLATNAACGAKREDAAPSA